MCVCVCMRTCTNDNRKQRVNYRVFYPISIRSNREFDFHAVGAWLHDRFNVTVGIVDGGQFLAIRDNVHSREIT